MIAKPSNVRPAQVQDSEKLFAFLNVAYLDNAPYRINEKKVRNFIAEGAADKVVIIGLIDAPDKDMIAGSIGAVFSQFWYTDDWHIDECWNFVHPDYRKSTYAKDLISYGKWIAESMGMPAHIGILTATRMEPKIRLYRRQDLTQVGALFAYNMATAHGPIAEEIACG